MPLPVLETPKFTLTLPTTKQKVNFRPFLVKEEKVLMLAQQSEDSNSMFRAMIDIVDACTFNELDVQKLHLVDIEFIFLKLRAKSVGESVDLSMICEECQTEVPLKINLDKIRVKYPKDTVDPKMQLTESVGIVCSHPTVRTMMTVQKDDPIEVISAAIETIFDKEQTYNVSEETPEEVRKFVETLTFDQLQGIKDFIECAPKITHTAKYDCPNCNHKNEKVIEGAESFFELA